MRRGAFIVAVLGLAAWAGAALARPPVVVELFTAQGCSSCGKASAYLADLADQKGVIALTFDVDYWDYLGWKDTFAQPQFTERQRLYARALDVAEIYTPQVVIDGRVQVAGVRPEAIARLVRQAARAIPDPPDMTLSHDYAAVGSGPRPRGGAEVWLVRYDPRQQTVEVKDGDNRGQSVVERNIVVQLERLGAWRGRPERFRLPAAAQDGLATVILVQAREGGRILGVMQNPAPRASAAPPASAPTPRG
ncbi:MAG TPA: DUF1223 domain-containing protein [Caulobacteraceae bacterium]|nr:DUF1223 domain-containing protein [Caulobacteraceae bacterium]